MTLRVTIRQTWTRPEFRYHHGKPAQRFTTPFPSNHQSDRIPTAATWFSNLNCKVGFLSPVETARLHDNRWRTASAQDSGFVCLSFFILVIKYHLDDHQVFDAVDDFNDGVQEDLMLLSLKSFFLSFKI
jgi:hypothetical protein